MKSDSIRILVVEDNPVNIEAAKEQLASHDLTVTTTYNDARSLLVERGFGFEEEGIPFEVVLTDVMLPFSNGPDPRAANGYHPVIRPNVFREIKGEAPYGPIIALHALQRGIKRVGVLTSGNHHDDQFVFAFDGLSGFSAGDVKVICSQGYNLRPVENKEGEEVKNWKDLLGRLLKGDD